MNVRISERGERIIRSEVASGRYASEDKVVEEALKRLDDLKAEKSLTNEEKPDRPLTDQEFLHRLVELGMMTELPKPEADWDDSEESLIELEGEPMSETVIRERR